MATGLVQSGVVVDAKPEVIPGESLEVVHVTAAATPAPMATTSAEAASALTFDDLVAHLASGCRPKETYKIGTEHEKFGFYTETHQRMNYDDVKYILNTLVEKHGWTSVCEGEYIIGAEKGKANVSLEPGGQFELSGAPLEDLNGTFEETSAHIELVNQIAAERGVRFLGTGFDPVTKVEDVPIMPKGRYRLMREYMPKVGTLGLDMMFRTCTIQVNLDFSSEQDMINKFRVSLALQPIATALFASSPLRDGKPNGFQSFRSHVWTDTDNARTGDLPFVFQEGFGFRRYAEFAMDVPMYFVYRKSQPGGYIDATGLSFRDFMEGKLSVLPGERPSMEDWENHLTTIFPEVRLKRFLEMRGADGGPLRRITALSAFWVGLLYDEETLAEAGKLIADWTDEERNHLRKVVPQTGLKTSFRSGTVKELSEKVVALAVAGLERRGKGEEKYLDEIVKVAKTGETLSDVMLKAYHEAGDSVEAVFKLDGEDGILF